MCKFGLFDIDGDGHMDFAESALEWTIIISALDEIEKANIADEQGVDVEDLDDMIQLADKLGVDIDDLEDIIDRANEQGIDIEDLEDVDDLEDFDEDESDE